MIASGSITRNDNFVLSVSFDDPSLIDDISMGESVSLIEVIENGSSVMGMRYCIVSSIDYASGLISVESNIKIGI